MGAQGQTFGVECSPRSAEEQALQQVGQAVVRIARSSVCQDQQQAGVWLRYACLTWTSL